MESEIQTESQRESQRVVLIHDTSGGVKIKALKWVLEGFSLEAGDTFTFLSVLNQIYHPLGYKIRVDGSMFVGANQKVIDDELAKKKKEFNNNLELAQVSKLYEMQKIDFKIELVAGPIPKNAAVEAAKKINATWVILDRRMKRDRKYFLERLSCGISRMKHNDEIIKIRGPKLLTRQAQNDEDLFSIEFDSSCTSSTSTRTSISDLSLGNNQDDKITQLSTLLEALGEGQDSSPGVTIRNQDETPPMLEEQVELDLKKCTTCSSTRPTSVWKSRNFSYSELRDATNRFSSENLIYRGENEAVFHGTLKSSKLDVIVKEQKDIKKYKSEMQALEKTRMENVIMLLGICLEFPRLMVFEYGCSGSLDKHLSHQNTKPLTWTTRVNIAFGASRGLYNLHANNIIHGDVRPKNIFLTHDFEPLLAGFGLARMNNRTQNSSDHFIIGTFGYVAPEYTKRGKSTTQTDVYAFGVVLLELVTGRSPTDTRLKGQSLLKWAIPLIQDRKYSELIDPRISYQDNQLTSIVQIAVECLCANAHTRLSMEDVMHKLDCIKDENISHDDQCANEIEEVNENVETICQSQRHFDEKVNFSYGAMTPLPKQAKHFYQVAQT
ncbi:probable serine/threonine-protein kinase PBL17 isoform X1 [Tanacetum coccineum]